MLKVFLSCGVANEEADPGLGGKYDYFFSWHFVGWKIFAAGKCQNFLTAKRKTNKNAIG